MFEIDRHEKYAQKIQNVNGAIQSKALCGSKCNFKF